MWKDLKQQILEEFADVADHSIDVLEMKACGLNIRTRGRQEPTRRVKGEPVGRDPEKYRVVKARYQASEKGRAATERYNQSEKGKAANLARQRRFVERRRAKRLAAAAG